MEVDKKIQMVGNNLAKSELEDGTKYTIRLSNHLDTQRKISITKGYEPRKIDQLNLLRFNHILRDHLSKMIKAPGKYVLQIGKAPYDSTAYYFLLAVEPDKFNENEWFVTVVTTVSSSDTQITFKRVPFSNRFVSKYFYEDLVQMEELKTKDEK